MKAGDVWAATEPARSVRVTGRRAEGLPDLLLRGLGQVLNETSPCTQKPQRCHLVLLVLNDGSGVVVELSSLEDASGRPTRQPDPRLPVIARGDIAPFGRRCDVRIHDGLDVWKPHRPTAATNELLGSIPTEGQPFQRIVDAILGSGFTDSEVVKSLRRAYGKKEPVP